MIKLEKFKPNRFGRSGENLAVTIGADVSAWVAEYPSGTGTLVYKRPDGQTYPLTATLSGGLLTAVLTSVDTAVPGMCRVEAQWLDNGKIAKSRTFGGVIAASIGEAGSIPAQSPSWVDDMAALGAAVGADAAQVAADKATVAADKASAAGSAADAQAAQIAAEQSAASAEQTAARIVTNEAERASAEQNRVSAEQARVTAESARGTALNTHMGDNENPHAVTAEQVHAVSYEEAQALTDTQKARARENIGAVTADPIYSQNLYDVSNANYDYGYYDNTGKFISSANYAVTIIVDLAAGSYVYAGARGALGAAAATVALFGQSGVQTGYLTATQGNAIDTRRNAYTFTLDADSRVRVNIGDCRNASTIANYVTPFMLCSGSAYPTVYEAYSASPVGYALAENVFSLKINTLFEKKIVFDGDSICAADTDTVYGAGYGYAGRIGQGNRMVWKNYAVSGGTIASGLYRPISGAPVWSVRTYYMLVDGVYTVASEGTWNGTDTLYLPRHWIAANISTMLTDMPDADIIVLEGGVNDASLQVPLGTISNGYDAALDVNTFYGAMETMLKTALAGWIGKKILYVIPYKIGSIATQTNHAPYFSAAIEACEKWSVPYIDLRKTSGVCVNIPAVQAALFVANDDWHVKSAGYDVISPAIEAEIRSL